MSASAPSIPAPPNKNRHRAARTPWPRRRKIAAAIIGASLAGTAAFAATNWLVGLQAGSSGEAQSGTVANISIVAVATPSPANLLFPGANGDVVAKITNPNAFPVTLSAVNLPTNTTYAAGFSDSGLVTAQTGCSSTTSLVSWNFSTATNNTSHTLATPITVAANGNITITFTNVASMDLNSPSACQTTFFKMPSLTNITATAGAATTTVAITDTWTS